MCVHCNLIQILTIQECDCDLPRIKLLLDLDTIGNTSLKNISEKTF